MLNYSDLWRSRFQGKSVWFCPPAARCNTSKYEESEKVGKVRSALGLCYKPDLHYALGHMRRWDGAIPPLANGTKVVDILAEDGKPRSVLLARQCRFDHENNPRTCSGMCCAKATLCTGTGFLGFTTRCLQNLSRPSRDRCQNQGAPVFLSISVGHYSLQFSNTWIYLNNNT
jgi:hypothetical protein